MRKTLFLLTFLLIGVSTAFSAVTIDTFGVSRRDADENNADIFTQYYNGLLNVGVETRMYLKGTSDAGVAGAAWTVTQAPTGSATAVTETADMGTNTQIAAFVPDVAGTYLVEFSDGAEAATLTINAALYTGIAAGACANCHQDLAAGWGETGHASALVGEFDNPNGHLQPFCVPCHSTGNDANAANNGFDDFDFVFPDVFAPGKSAELATLYPDAMARADVQCEVCHGPGSSHYGNVSDSKMVSTLSADNCAICHDAGTHHVFPEQWDVSGHANPPAYPAGGRTTCRGCHNGAQFVQFVKGEEITVQPNIPITCATCHDPHNGENPNQVRTTKATLSNGEEITQGGTGKLCMNCHQSRRDANTYTNAPASHFGPHYVPQADMISGKNAVTFGKQLPSSPHLASIENSCVNCHMAENHVDDEGNVILVGSHSFKVVDDEGNANVEICASCHGDVGESFDEKKFYVNGKADHDMDGTEEGLQGEVHGLMDILAEMLPHHPDSAAYDPHDSVDSTWTKTELKAAFNYQMVYYDHSYGIHNPAFTVALLKVSIQALLNNAIEGDIVAIEDIPNDQGKQVWIVWDKFVDDGIAIDPIVQYVVKRNDGPVWTGVGQHPADGSMRYALVVPTLYDSTAMGDGKTEFKVVALTRSGNVHESLPGMGYSVDNLIPMAPSGFMAALAGNEVMMTWEESEDVDFNYFAIYKGTEAGFVPSEENQIATTTGMEFTDTEIETGNTYYYKIAAYDFSGNESEFAHADPVIVTGVNGRDKAVPTDFSLSQNYPNPFNPTTVIEFGVPSADQVQINIYDIRGVHVRTLAYGKFAAGYHTLTWDGRDDNGSLVSAGTYLYRLESKTQSFTKKAIFLK